MNQRFYFFRGMFLLIISLMFVVPVSAQILGGYSDVSVNDPDVIAAANFAVSEQAKQERAQGDHGSFKLQEILSAKKQIVAGTNYKLQLKVKVKNNIKNAEAVVYRNLQGTYQLSSWIWQ